MSTLPSSSSSPSQNPRRIIPEDTVVYAIYPDPPHPPLDSLRLQLLSSLSPFLRDYIWQHDPFHLTVPPPSPSCPLCLSPSPPHLHGKSRFGDNVLDEWFLVSLLLHLSRSFPSLSIRVWDSDGEFLLIESAFALPRWLDPDTSPRRVFLRAGDLHILGRRSFPIGSQFSLADALAALRGGREPTRASDAVQSAIARRIAGLPEDGGRLMHRVRVRVPLPVARVMREEPCLISLAVEGFYDRDVDSMKHASKMERFLRSEGAAVDVVLASVRMSRAMYGQLVQQKFQAPRCYPMPRRDEGAALFVEAELGMKIACGLEMMYQERKRFGEEGKGSTWEAFKDSLERSGYFRNLLPGSKEYKQLMHDAEENYKNSSLFSRSSNVLNAPVRRIDEILASPCSASEFKSVDVSPSDDDSWLYDGEDELNAELSERQKEMEMYELKRTKLSGKQKASDADSCAPEDENNVREMAKTLHSFVEKVSSFEGVEVPENRDLKEVDFDVDCFMECLKLVGEHGSEQQTDSDFNLEEQSSSSDRDLDESVDSEDEIHPDENHSCDRFMQSYSSALNKELKSTTLEKSFIGVQHDISSASKEISTSANDLDEDLATVNIDSNLVMSLLDSYVSQQGLPGPASNLLGSLGIKLSNGKDEINHEK